MDANTKHSQTGPGKAFRKRLTLVEVIRPFPNDAAAEAWNAQIRWPNGPRCPHCDHDDVQHPTAHKTMPDRCPSKGCRQFFSVPVGTVMQDSKLVEYQEWGIATYLYNTNLKSVSSMKLHRDLGISQKSAWHLVHRTLNCWDDLSGDPFEGPTEVDESHFGGRAGNMHAEVCRERITGRGAVDKTTVVAAKDRATNRIAATVVSDTDEATLQGFVTDHAGAGAMVYTDEHRSHEGLPRYETVRHSVAENVREQAHMTGIESFCTDLKVGYPGASHHVSPEHLDRYVREFVGRHSRRRLDTERMMAATVRGMAGKRLTYAKLVAAGPAATNAAAAAASVPTGHPS